MSMFCKLFKVVKVGRMNIRKCWALKNCLLFRGREREIIRFCWRVCEIFFFLRVRQLLVPYISMF